MLKFYVHTIASADLPEFSWAAKNIDPSLAASAVAQKFVDAFNKKFPSQGIHSPSELSLYHDEAKKKPLTIELDVPISKYVKNQADVFVTRNAGHVTEAEVPHKEEAKEEEKREHKQKEEPKNSDDKPKKPLEQIIAEDRAEAGALKDEGNQLMTAKKYAEALAKYSHAIELDPTNAVLYANRAQANINLDKFQDIVAAIADAEKCLVLDPKNAKAYFRKGFALVKMSRYEEARTVFTSGLSLPNIDDATKSSLTTWLKTADSKIAEETKAAKNTTMPKAPTVTSSRTSEPETAEAKAFIKEAHRLGKSNEDKKNFRTAAALYQEALKVSEYDKVSLMQLGSIYFNARKYKQAVEYFNKGFLYHVLSLDFALKLAESYRKLKEYKSAAEVLATAMKRCTSATERRLVKVRIGEIFYEVGDQATGVNYFRDVIKEDDENFDALFAYAQALIDHGTVPDDSLPVYLKLLVKDTENQKVKVKLSALCMHERGYDVLKENLKAIPNSASALGFLANVIKDNGALETAERLYLDALDLEPSSQTLALNLVHIQEMRGKLEDVFQQAKKFMKENKDLNVGQLTNAHFYNVLRNYESLQAKSSSDVAELAATTKPTLPVEQMYPPNQLDLFALFCTLVKTVFLAGRLELIKPLTSLMRPITDGRQMHTTTIRNENAYYSCIDQLMGYHKEIEQREELPPLYWAGDSHALVTAWHRINYQGVPHRIIPKLVTGLKCWHLRPESTFYPKYNFFNVVRTIPKGAHVVFQFGEIDCREGIVFAVQKMLYEDISEGARVAIDHYINVLLDLQKEYEWTIHVHPPAPVIDVTRDIVKNFNSILKQRIQETPGLHYLDFFDAMLSDDKAKLNPKFELDGTHMNPTYLPLVESSLAV